jgi:GABA(A) receptor-associated protein
MNNTFAYDAHKSFEDRLKEASEIIKKYPDKIPVIVEPISQNNDNTSNLDRNKFLCPKDINIGHFLSILRNRLNLKATQSVYLFINNKTPSNNMQMGDIYLNYCDKDKFLKIKYGLENFFGNK